MKERITYSKSFSPSNIFREKSSDCCIIFIHGFSESSVCWDDIITTLSGSSNFITYDCIGHGDNANLWQNLSVDAYVTQLEELAQYLRAKEGFDKFIFVGHSQGAAISAQCALRNPKLVDGLMLISPFFTVKSPLEAIWTNYLEMVQQGDIERFWDINSSLLLGPKSGIWSNMRRQTIEDRVKTFEKVQLEALIHTLLKIQVNGDISQLNEKEIFLVHGEYDAMFPRYYSHEIMEHLPNAKYYEVSRASHLLVEMEPDLSIQLDNLIKTVQNS